MNVPVVIAGGGPVGMTLAMDLATRGIKSVVLEARRNLPPNPRCNTTNARSMEFLRRLGCAGAVRAAGLPPEHNTDVVYMMTMTGPEVQRYQRPTPRDIFRGEARGIGSNWPTPEPQHFISQLYLEPVLRRHAMDHHGVEVLMGWRLESFEQDDEGVTAIACDVETGERRTLRAQYLVGADGGASVVRRNIGARLQGIPRIADSVSVFIRAPFMRQVQRDNPGWMYRIIGGVMAVAINGDDEWLFHTNPGPGESLADFDPEPQIFAAVGAKFAYETLNVARWTARAMVANKFREGRVLLAGDAAHIWIPMGGFGMNAGIGDSMSLGWRLAGVLQNWLSPQHLDSYEIERTPMGANVAMRAARWGADLRPVVRPDAEALKKLNESAEARADLGARIREINTSEWESVGLMLGYCYENSPVIAYDGTPAPPFELSNYQETSWPGARAPHIWRDDGASLYDQLGLGFTLLRIGAGDLRGQALIDEAQRRSVPLTVLDVPDAEAVKKYQGYGLVLVRPDQHIVWRSKTEPGDAGGVLDRVTGALMPARVVRRMRAERIADGFIFPAGLRRRGDDLVFSDMAGSKLLRYDVAKKALTTLHELECQPNGLATLPDGRLLIASMLDSKLLVLDGAKLSIYADLSYLVTGYLGDMAIDNSGRVFVGDVGARVLHGEAPKPGRVIRVDPDGSARIVLDKLQLPNGIGITPDGARLIVSETMGAQLLQCRIEANGELSDPRPLVRFRQAPAPASRSGADGITIDRDGGVWACLPAEGCINHYDAAGRLTASVQSPAGLPIACALGDDDTLYIVGCEPLPDGLTVFEAIAKKATRGWLAHVALTSPL